jgi:transposase InsO family protein
MYLRTLGALVYLATGLDVFERKVAGWALSGGLKTSHTTIPAIEAAFAGRKARRV